MFACTTAGQLWSHLCSCWGSQRPRGVAASLTPPHDATGLNLEKKSGTGERPQPAVPGSQQEAGLKHKGERSKKKDSKKTLAGLDSSLTSKMMGCWWKTKSVKAFSASFLWRSVWKSALKHSPSGYRGRQGQRERSLFSFVIALIWCTYKKQTLFIPLLDIPTDLEWTQLDRAIDRWQEPPVDHSELLFHSAWTPIGHRSWE